MLTVKRTAYTLLAALLATAFAAPAQKNHYSLFVANFCELTVVDGINVHYHTRPDSAGWVVFDAPASEASKISFTNNKEHLKIQTLAEDTPLKSVPTIHVYSASLRQAENSGDSTLYVHITIPVKKFAAKQIGNGRTIVENITADEFEGHTSAGHGSLLAGGRSGKTKLRSVGAGFLDAADLQSPNVSCFVLGTGNIAVDTSGELIVKGAGTGKVVNRATAAKIKNHSLGVKVEQPSTSASE